MIEGDGKSILYTGDIRSEPWFVNSIARSPILVEYTSGLKTLDKIYLDTSYTYDVGFQTKAQGIAELLKKVSKYPADTVFHFQAWTYGYEDVWVALSKALKSPVGAPQNIENTSNQTGPRRRLQTPHLQLPQGSLLGGSFRQRLPPYSRIAGAHGVHVRQLSPGGLLDFGRVGSTSQLREREHV